MFTIFDKMILLAKFLDGWILDHMSVLLRRYIMKFSIFFQGPAGRRSQPADATKEDFFASILRSNEVAHADSSRMRRQSRVSREIVSSHQGPYP